MPEQNNPTYDERLRRWRLILGGEKADGIEMELSTTDNAIDRTLSALYDSDQKAGLGSSAPNVARWLGDIRTYFPTSVIKIMQQDALERINLRQMLMQPELLQEVQPDVHLVANLLSLSNILPAKTKETARMVVRKVVEEIEQKLANPLRQAVNGSLNRSARNRRPHYNEIDWPRTIRANLKTYQPEYKTIIPETRIGYGRKRSSLRDIILCVDESGSMATSVVYAGIFGAVLASLPAVNTRVVVFDTAVVDLSEDLSDPVELLFGTQLGGGTDINRALAYCHTLIRKPQETILVLITDLYEGGNQEELIKRAATLVNMGIQFIVLLALNDKGAPSYDQKMAAIFAGMEIPVFASSPDLFPDLMSSAIQQRNIQEWAATNGVVANRAKG